MRKSKSPHPVDVHVGRRVKTRRVLREMSQSNLADQLGLTFQQLQKYESGANRISASRLWQIAQILGVPVAWFFEGLDGHAEEVDAKLDSEILKTAQAVQSLPPGLRKSVQSAIASLADMMGQP